MRIPRGFDLDAAARHLRRSDPALSRWMRRLGPIEPDPRWRRRLDIVDSLARSIVYQQLSGKAAATIVGRVEAAAGVRRLDAEALSSLDDATLRACGISANKLRALRDLVDHARRGAVPSVARMAHMPDDAIVEALTAVRGIGRWTVEMLLMFHLGRADVLPVDDLGIRKGAQRLDGLDALPAPRLLAARGEAWGPYRTLAGFYLWRIADG